MYIYVPGLGVRGPPPRCKGKGVPPPPPVGWVGSGLGPSPPPESIFRHPLDQIQTSCVYALSFLECFMGVTAGTVCRALAMMIIRNTTRKILPYISNQHFVGKEMSTVS